MKPLTKEEFLDKKNAKIHQDLLKVFDLDKQCDRVFDYIQKNRIEYPEKFECSIERSPNILNVNRMCLQFIVDVSEMIKSGDLVFKNKESSTN
jgi:hypothetical protein